MPKGRAGATVPAVQARFARKDLRFLPRMLPPGNNFPIDLAKSQRRELVTRAAGYRVPTEAAQASDFRLQAPGFRFQVPGFQAAGFWPQPTRRSHVTDPRFEI
jgi:hypothetical protein